MRGEGLVGRLVGAVGRGLSALRGPARRAAARAAAAAAAGPAFVLFADLDGTFLDPATLEPAEAGAALDRLRRARGHLSLVTGKTFAEVLPLWRRLALRGPFAVESGAVTYFPRELFRTMPEGARARANGPFHVVSSGPWRAQVVAELRQAAREAGATVRSFAGMSVAEVAAVTGLQRDLATLAMTRSHSEPFLLVEGDAARLEAALAKRGLRLTRGDRFFHVHGPADKGAAARLVAGAYRAAFGDGVVTAAIGHAPDDHSLFEAVERSFVLRGPDGAFDPALIAAGAVPVDPPGPRGFAAAVDLLVEPEPQPAAATPP